MTKSKLTGQRGTVTNTWPDGKEELQLAHQLLVGLRYHIQTQYLLSSRKAKQRIIIGIAVIATLLTALVAILR
ncbi:hypothetical protein [Parapedobacter koreensis]|uniref:Uncharacterized protein n=1 Tax=Parapedobacter koreensis TaxID=332977 RepID=A0A1H7FMH5_9SPHI|nr:hypothetical protein [Parapedobacter koreensis]SEK27303.1 hypothetical protein SAMN05421740_101407 [Parapedobacter koreensis]